MSDIFREIEQDLRRDKLSNIWEKYGLYIIGLAVAIVVATAAVVGWQQWEKSANEAASARYDEVLADVQKEKPEVAAEKFGAFAQDSSGGYAVLAQLQQADALMRAGKTDEAAKTFEDVATDSDATDIIRGMASIKAMLLTLDKSSLDDVKTRMMPLVEERSPWAANAHELMGLAAYRAGDYQFANEQFQAILESQNIAPGMRDRAHVMQAVLAPELAKTDDKPQGKVSDAKPAEEKPAEGASEGKTDEAPAKAGADAANGK